MAVTTLWLTDFRCFTEVSIEFDPGGLTVLRGPNGSGKTSILEAVGWLATQRSLRGAPRDVVVRSGAARAVVRAEATAGDRHLLVEAELATSGPARMQVNRQVVRNRAELAQAVRVTAFSPGDLDLVQEGPAGRRDYLDEVLVDRHPRLEALVGEVERILRQRAAVLRQAGGRLDDEVGATLDVWDDRLMASGTALAEARQELVDELSPLASAAYGQLAGAPAAVVLSYRRSWEGDLGEALVGARADDVRRQLTSLGPHRDEMAITLGPGPARTHASQGEQRCVALALRLATHELRSRGAAEPPVLLLDDVFSELDPERSARLVDQLPPGQVLLATASDPPAAVTHDRVVRVGAGGVSTLAARP